MNRFIVTVFTAALLSTALVHAHDFDEMCESPHSKPHQHDSIKIGVMFVASGPMAGYGRHGRQAVELAVNQINASGGIHGKKVNFRFEDTELNASRIKEIAERFIKKDNVDFLIGPTSSGLAVTLSEIAKMYRIPLILTQAADVTLTGEYFHKYVFATLSNSMMHARSGALVAAEMPYTRWMVIGPNYNYGHSSWEMFRDKLQQLHPEITVEGELFPPLMSMDYTLYIQEIWNKSPQAVWAPLWGNDAVLFIKQAMSLHSDFFQKIKFFIPDGASLEILDPVGSDMPDGIMMSSRYYFASPNTAENSMFINAYQTRFGEMPDYMASETYSGVYFIKAAIERAKSINAQKFVEAVEREPLAWNTPEGWKIMRIEDHQVVEDVLWGMTAYKPGKSKADVIDIRSIQGEMIVRTPEELQGINP